MTLIAAILLFLAVWIVIPAPTIWLLPLGVGVPEFSPILLAAALIVVLLSFRGKSVKKLAVVIALAAAGLAAIPLSKVSATVRAFDRALAAAYPKSGIGDATGMRPKPIVPRDLFLGIQTGEPRVMRAIPFATAEGLPLVLDVYKPEATGRYPILVQIHGGAWERGARTDNETFARYFASHGYVVVAIEYRHAPRWKWPAQLADVRAGMAWVRSSASSNTFEGDGSRVAIIGRSSGAQLALLTAYVDGGARAVVSYYGPTDLTEGWKDPPKPDPMSVRSVLEGYLGGTPATVPGNYIEASPITYASGASAATLQIQGAQDHVVRPRFARALHQRLTAARARSVLLEIPWAEHAFDAAPHGLSGQLALYYTERFLAEALALGR